MFKVLIIFFISKYSHWAQALIMIFINQGYQWWKFSETIRHHVKVKNNLGVAQTSRFWSTDGAVPSQNWVHLLLTGSERVETDGSAPKLCVTTWRETSRGTQQSVPACVCHVQERTTLNTVNYSCQLWHWNLDRVLHRHTDPCRWDGRGGEKIAVTYANTIIIFREIDATDVEFMLLGGKLKKISSVVWILSLMIHQANVMQLL